MDNKSHFTSEKPSVLPVRGTKEHAEKQTETETKGKNDETPASHSDDSAKS